ESQQAGGRAFDRQIGPLSLSFDAQMRSTLFVGDLQTPAFDKIFHDLPCRLRLVSREVRFRLPFALRITREHPADRQWLGPCRIPQCCPCGDSELAFAPPIPVDREHFPLRLRVAQHRTQVREPLPNPTGPSLLM